jgi:uncharacterized protein
LSATATGAERLAYADSSALVKLVVLEAETHDLQDHLADSPAQLITSRIALVEVTRAATLTNQVDEMHSALDRLFASCLLVDVGAGLLSQAAKLASQRLRTLNAIHLATALDVQPDEAIVYDQRLVEAASAAGLTVVSPGR